MIYYGIIQRNTCSCAFKISNANQVVELQSYLALCRIKDVLDDDTLVDRECFAKIEEIVCVFESIGSDGGCRHDFG